MSQAKIILIVFSVCALVGIGVVAFLYYGGKQSQDSATTPTDVQNNKKSYLRAEFEQTAQPIDTSLFGQND